MALLLKDEICDNSEQVLNQSLLWTFIDAFFKSVILFICYIVVLFHGYMHGLVHVFMCIHRMI